METAHASEIESEPQKKRLQIKKSSHFIMSTPCNMCYEDSGAPAEYHGTAYECSACRQCTCWLCCVAEITCNTWEDVYCMSCAIALGHRKLEDFGEHDQATYHARRLLCLKSARK